MFGPSESESGSDKDKRITASIKEIVFTFPFALNSALAYAIECLKVGFHDVLHYFKIISQSFSRYKKGPEVSVFSI